MGEESAWRPDWLGRSARVTPARPALVWEGGDLSFGELDAAAERTAARLRRAGAGPGRVVAVLVRGRATAARLVHGVARSGSVLLPVSDRLTVVEVAWIVADAAAAVLVVDGATEEIARAAVAGANGPTVVVADELLAEAAEHPSRDPERLLDLAARHSVVYTSGTTGRPKAVSLTWGNHWSSAVGSALRLGLGHGDRWLACLPFNHVGGLAILLRGAIHGTTVVVHERFEPEAVNRSLDRDRITGVSLVPTMLEQVLEARGVRPWPETLRCVLVGGGPLPVELERRCRDRSVPVAATYGLTEAASQVATAVPGARDDRPGSVGLPLAHTEVRVVAPGGAPVAVGGSGEILVRGPTVSSGAAGDDGWLRTGDLGRVDEVGHLWVLGRRADRIVSGGENVDPVEVEGVLAGHPDVVEACVVGVEDGAWGERVVASVVVAPGRHLDVEELTAHCRQHLAGFKVPIRIVPVETLPRTVSGKLRRTAVRECWRGTVGSDS